MPAGEETSDITGLRVLLVADLLTRIAELGHLQVLTMLASGSQPAAHTAAVTDLADKLGIHPPAARGKCADARATLGGPVDVHLVSGAASVDDHQGRLEVHVGAARMRQANGDPLAIRLALMSFPYHQPADITETALARAHETLGRWRRMVAGWAEMPSKPVPSRITDAIRAACSDLDTGAMLALLDNLTVDTSVPTGAKFEGFLYADRILGLELAREIGRY
jgi:hypothetical protein